ncbi:MAG: MCE family protein [Actinomycetota bacterium]|nr:MCE family protein [Actinomycetota bacterium]
MRGLLSPLIKLIVFLIVTTFAIYVLGATIANTSYGSTQSYKAMFSDVAGLSNGDDVRVAGVRVGTVSGIKLIHHNNSSGKGAPCTKSNTAESVCSDSVAQITFTVIKSRPLPRSVTAVLRYRNLVGQRYLDLQQGAGNPNDLLPNHGTIGIDHTQPAVDLTTLFNGFQPLFQGLDAVQINQLSFEVINALQGQGGSLELLLTNLADITNTIADKDQVIGNVVDNLGSALTAVGNRDTELSNLIVQLQGFISGLAADRVSIGNSIDGINILATTTAGLLTKVRAPLAKDITDLTALTANLNRNSGVVTKFLQNLPGTVGTLVHTGSYGSWFNFYLCSITADVTLPGAGVIHIPASQSSAARCNG